VMMEIKKKGKTAGRKVAQNRQQRGLDKKRKTEKGGEKCCKKDPGPARKEKKRRGRGNLGVTSKGRKERVVYQVKRLGTALTKRKESLGKKVRQKYIPGGK